MVDVTTQYNKDVNMVVLSFVRICGKRLECLTVFVMGFYSCFLRQSYHVAKDDLELLIPTVCFPNAAITGLCLHSWFGSS